MSEWQRSIGMEILAGLREIKAGHIGRVVKMAIFPIPERPGGPSPAVLTIFPYRHDSAWVFDDDRVGLVKEPFVSGVDLMIDRLTAGIPNAATGFRLDFSARPFDGWQKSLTWLRADPVEGHWYRADDDGSEGWLCPALFWYFPSAPAKIYMAAADRIASDNTSS